MPRAPKTFLETVVDDAVHHGREFSQQAGVGAV